MSLMHILQLSNSTRNLNVTQQFQTIFLGNYGNTIDGQALPGEVVDEVRKNGENPFIHPLTPPVRPVTNDRQYYHIPWEDSKPCTHIKLTWQDHRRRLYNSNVLLKICERLVSCKSLIRLCHKTNFSRGDLSCGP